MSASAKPKIAIIIGTTRPTRFADKPAAWLLEIASRRTDMDFEIVDIRDFDLPFFDEMASNLWMPSQNPKAIRWQKTLAGYDGFVFVTAEYNHSIPASLKNALDQAYVEWNKKPAAILSYGSVGGARAAEHLRTILVELQMVPIRSSVHIGGSEMLKVHPMGANGPIEEIEAAILPGTKDMLNQLAWWAELTRAGRTRDAEQEEADRAA